MSAPCYKCKDRTLVCHSECEKYLKYRKAIDDKKAKEREYTEYLDDAMERMRTKRKQM